MFRYFYYVAHEIVLFMCETFKSRRSCCSKLKDRSNDESIYLVLGPQSMAGAITSLCENINVGFYALLGEKSHGKCERELLSFPSDERA